ncbi:MAG TPA: MerR family transcriptional regulator [Longimicrobiales bacterium]|nr:MerR family transcriptional regulator [Longimicrobiales bacterium]
MTERDAELWREIETGPDAAGSDATDAEREAPPRGRGGAAARRSGEAGTGGGQRPIAHKEYYSISEVCDLVGLKPHVLRYWESQFPVLNPSKNRSGNRVYQRKEIKLILLVQHLLYEEKYTIEGAKQRLEQLRRGGELPAATARALDREMLGLLRAELHQALEILSPGTDS